MKNKRLGYIDLMKTLAIIMVIALHIDIFQVDFIKNDSITTLIKYAIRIISEGVPIFVMINGFLIIHKSNFDLKKHMKKTAKLFVLLIVWSIIITIISKIIWKEEIYLTDIIKNIFLTNIRNKYSGVLWFLQSLINLYLMYPIIKKVHDTDKKIYNYFFIIVLIMTVGINSLSLISNLLSQTINFKNLELIIQYTGNFKIVENGEFLMFFMLGGYIYEFREKLDEKQIAFKCILLGLISWIIALIYAVVISKIQGKVYSSSFNYHTIFILFSIIGIFAITYRYKGMKNNIVDKIIECIGKNTFGIYFVHILIIRTLNRFYKTENFWINILILFAVLFMSLLITLILRKIPKIKNIIEI